MKKFLLALLAGILIIGFLPANGSKEDSGTEGKTVLRVIDWSDSTAEYKKQFNEQYMADHPDIIIEYTVMTIDQFKTSVINSIKSGGAPDLFPYPVGFNLPMAVSEDWFTPLNDLVPSDFWDTVDPGAVAEGVGSMDGNYYVLPEVAPLSNELIFYNQDVLDAAGIKKLPATYSEFLDVNRRISEAGKGQYYGFIEGGKQVNRLYGLVAGFSNVAGGRLPPFNYALTHNGRISYDTPAVLGAFALFDQLFKDGSVHPDSINISAPEAREYFAQGQAAFIMQGIWCIGIWEKTHPEMNFGVMPVPKPDGGASGKLYLPHYNGWMGVYSQSQHPREAAEYLIASYNYGSDAYHYQDDLTAKGGQISIIKGVAEKNLTNPRVRQYYETSKAEAVIYPKAASRDPKAYDFYSEVVDVQPSAGIILQGVLSGSIPDYEAELTKLSDKLTAEWKRASEAIGLDFGVFEFPNWDPMVNYTNEDYGELK